jgi:TP901 family phage tail tape measure protein
MAGKKFSIEAVFSALDKLSAPVAKIKTKLGELGKGASSALKGANAAVDKGLAGLGKFSDAAGIAGVASVAGLGLALRQTIEEGADFERTMTFAAAQFPGMIKQGTKEFAALEQAARTVGDATEFSSSQAAEGLTLLATAGLSAEAAIGALPKVVNFATASKVEFADASDIALNSMSAFGLASENASENAANMSRTMDVLTRAAADSTTNVSELFEAIKMGGTVAKSSGMSLEQFIGYTEVLANVGIKGGEGGTAIRNMLLELGKPSTTAAKGMKALGVKLATTKSGAIDLTTTIGRFAKATAKMTKAQKIQALGNVFGARTIGPFMALMDAGPGKIDAFTKALEGAAGTTEGMSKLIGADALGQLRNFSSLIDGVKLDVFTAIRPVMLDIIKATSDWVTQNRELIKTKAGEWIVALRDNLPQIWTWTVRLSKAFLGFLAFAAAVKVINVAVAAYTVATKVAAAATWLWNAAAGSNALFTAKMVVEIVAYRVALLASRVATAAVTAATWLYNAALAVGELGTRRFTVSAVAAKVAQVASSVATAACTAAMWLYNGALIAVDLVTGRLTISTVAAKVAQLASQVATWLASAAQTAYATVVGVSSGALAAFTGAAWASITAIGAQAAALAPFLVTVAAATAAVTALYLAWDQFSKLSASLSGSGGIIGTASKMLEMGTLDPFAAHDAAMNDKARADRAERDRPQVVSPQARAAAETAEANATASVNGEIKVSAAPGAKATATSKPSTVPLRVQPSGAF